MPVKRNELSPVDVMQSLTFNPYYFGQLA